MKEISAPKRGELRLRRNAKRDCKRVQQDSHKSEKNHGAQLKGGKG